MIKIGEAINKALLIISNFDNKKRPECRKLIKFVNYEISMYRFTAWSMKGTNVASLCNQAANYLQKRLDYSLGIGVN